MTTNNQNPAENQTQTENRLQYDLSPQGIKALMKAPILATLSRLDFPHIRIEQQKDNEGQPFYVGVLWIDLQNIVIIEMAGATAFKEALAIIAYQQQMTKTPLLIDDEVEERTRYFYEHSQYGDGVNPFIEHLTGTEISLAMMTKHNREKVDLLFMEKRMNEGKA